MRIFASSSAWLASAVLHLTGFGVVAFGPRPALAPARVTTVELTVATVTPPPPPPPPPPIVPEVPRAALSPKAPAPTRAARPTSARVESAPPVATSPEPPAPLDLTGTTLTAERGDFAMAVGTGGFGAGGGGAPRAAVVVAPAAAPAGPALARHEDLSRLPAPPELSDALLAHYPARARAAGETGRATLSLIVYQDGTVGGIEVRSATSVDFAAACRETVRGSHWAPPVSKDGRATATRVGYTCHFDVR